MQEQIRPIKRSEQLATLSREHHDGLLFCWKIRQGLGNGTPLLTLRAYTQWYWREHMQPHFRLEEDILLPHLAGHPFAEQLKKEHQDIRDVVIALDKEPDINRFSILASFVSNHIRSEERHMFGYLEKTLSPDKLDLIADQLGHEPSPDDWNPRFWMKNTKETVRS